MSGTAPLKKKAYQSHKNKDNNTLPFTSTRRAALVRVTNNPTHMPELTVSLAAIATKRRRHRHSRHSSRKNNNNNIKAYYSSHPIPPFAARHLYSRLFALRRHRSLPATRIATPFLIASRFRHVLGLPLGKPPLLPFVLLRPRPPGHHEGACSA